MELDSKNLQRLLKICLYRVIKKRKMLFWKSIAFIYLLGGFCFFSLYFSYNIRIAVKPLSYFILLFKTAGFFFLYVLINHLLIRTALSHKTLLIFDTLVFILLISIFISDGWAENSVAVDLQPARTEERDSIGVKAPPLAESNLFPVVVANPHRLKNHLTPNALNIVNHSGMRKITPTFIEIF